MTLQDFENHHKLATVMTAAERCLRTTYKLIPMGQLSNEQLARMLTELERYKETVEALWKH